MADPNKPLEASTAVASNAPMGMWDQLESAIPVIGHVADLLHGRKPFMASMRPQDTGQLVYPERVFSESEQAQHPIRTGFDQFAGSLTSPDNLLLMQGLGALGVAPGRVGAFLPRIASAVFGGQMGKASLDAYQAARQNYQMYEQSGDERYKNEAYRLGTHSLLNGAFTLLSAGHALLGDTFGKEALKGSEPAKDLTVAPGVKESEATSQRTGLAPRGQFARPADATQAGVLAFEKPREPAKGQDVTRQITDRMAQLKAQGLSEPEQVFRLTKEFPAQAEDIIRGYKPPTKQVSGETPSAEKPVQPTEPIQTARPTERPGEPVRGLEGPKVDPWANLKYDQAAQKQAAAERDAGQLPSGMSYVQRAQQLKEQMMSAQKPEVQKGISASLPSPSIFDQRVKETLKRNPNMAEGTAKRIVAEQIRKESGVLSFRPLPQGQARQAFHPVQRLADALESTARFFEGNRGMSYEEIGRKEQAKDIIREEGSKLARSHLEVMQKLDAHIEEHDRPGNERQNFIQFMDAGEHKPGAQFLNPWDQAVADELHNMFEERWDKVKAVKGLEGDGIENYLAHIWEKPGQAQKKLAGIPTGKSPLQGSGRFLKQRFYQYASEGLDHGLAPVTWNPIRLQLQALFDVDRFLMAHDIKNRYKDAGLVQFTKFSEQKNLPPGWQKLDDKIFQPKMMEGGALKEYGTYFAPPEVAKVFNTYLKPGLGANPVFRGVRKYGNLLNLINLGVSGYHGTMISGVSAASDVALGLQKIFNFGDFKGGTKDLLRGTFGNVLLMSQVHDYKFGRDLQAQALGLKQDPGLQHYVDMLMQGGGRFKQDAWYTQGLYDRKGFNNWLRLSLKGRFDKMAEGAVRAIGGQIMDKYVPRIKLGAAARLMQNQLHDMVIRKGIVDEQQIAHAMGKIWDSMDNRAGQMVYDNLFWNRAAKDMAFLGIRAVGWDFGSIREFGGAATIDLPRQLGRMLRGQRPELTSRLAFSLAYPVTIGLIGGMIHYMLTGGQIPRKLEDYFFPGKEGEKISIPSYMKDWYSIWDDPVRTAINKLHPMWGQLHDVFLTNSDFYGTEIRHPGDQWTKQLWDEVKYAASTFEPLTVRNVQRRLARGESAAEAANSIFGFSPAPSYVGQTKAEGLAFTLAKRAWQAGPRTQGDAERHALVDRFEREQAAGGLKQDEVMQAWQEHKIHDSDFDKIFDVQQGDSKLVREFRGLKLPDALAVMREANANERTQLKEYLYDKYDQLEQYPEDMQQQYQNQLNQYLQ